ncbi:MAG: glycosyltransferase [Hyphomonadaceae bacterium]
MSAIVVARNIKSGDSGRAPLELCLRSALAEPWIDELIIVDQGNSDAISSKLRGFEADRRDVSVVTVDDNANAPAAANAGAKVARGRWLLFLDADVVIRRGAVARLAAAGGGAQAPWIVGGRLLDLNGRERNAVRAGSLSAFSALAVAMGLRARAPARLRVRVDGSAKPVAAVSGALMLIPRGDFQRLDGFDEGFVSDCADLDLCRRAVAAGGSVLFEPDASAVQFERARSRTRKQAQGLARFAERSAQTPAERAFARIARPALVVVLTLRDWVVGHPPQRR